MHKNLLGNTNHNLVIARRGTWVDTNFWHIFHCSHRLRVLCWIKSRVRDFSVKIALISYWNDFSPTPLGKCASYRSAPQICKKKSHFNNFESDLYLTSVSMPLRWWLRSTVIGKITTLTCYWIIAWFDVTWAIGCVIFDAVYAARMDPQDGYCKEKADSSCPTGSIRNSGCPFTRENQNMQRTT